MANNPQSSGAQFRPVLPTQQGQSFIPASSQQFRPVGQGIYSLNVGMATIQSQPMQFSQPMPQFPPRPSQPVNSVPSSQAMPVPYVQTNRPFTAGSPLPQNATTAMNNHMPSLGALGMPPSSAYTFVQSSYGHPQHNVTVSSQFQPISQIHAPVVPLPGQPWASSASQSAPLVTPGQQTGQQPSAASSTDTAAHVSSTMQSSSCDWQEHTSSDGRRYYYNKRTEQSSWEKPLELMTPIERADASTVWKEFTTPEGKKYYYNKVTKQSKWSIPEELKLAREQTQMAVSQGAQSELGANSNVPAAVVVSSTETPTRTVSASSTLPGVGSSPVPVTPVVAVTNVSPVVVSGPSTTPIAHSAGVVAPIVQPTMMTPTVAASGSTGVPPGLVNANTNIMSGSGNVVSQDAANSVDRATMQDTEEAKKGKAVAGETNATLVEDKTTDDEPLVFSNKLEAKNAFKALLESANVQSEWTWEQTMREIINDKRYGALKTLGERKQAFNEYLGQRKKLEAEERRMRQKKAKEEFTKMLEECKELTSSTKWSKAISMFENDDRFKAVERVRDREDLFDNYMVELERKEKEKAAEDHRQNIAEYRTFLESCDFIKVNSQWRKVQDRLEDEERCSRLEKIDRLIIFQDYIRDLEKEEEEQKKLQKEKLRRTERKNRDAFRKLMEEHIADETLTAKTHWHNYCSKVKDLPQYHAVASNISGSTPKDLFDDVAEELENQYHEDKTRIKDAMKSGKITMASTWTFEDFKVAVSEASLQISDINFKLVYEDLLERVKEKEEREAKKRQRLADDFTELLHTYKEITASSSWGDSKPLFEESQEYKLIGEESFGRQIFEEYIAHLVEKAKEKERRREEEKAKKEKEREEKEKRKDKERKEKDKEREREKGKERTKKDESDSENLDAADGHSHKEEKKKEKDKDRKHRKRHQSAVDEVSSDKDEREDSKRSRRHGSDRKKSRKHAYSPESDGESRHKRHRRDRDGSRRNGGYDELEDGELGEDGEI